MSGGGYVSRDDFLRMCEELGRKHAELENRLRHAIEEAVEPCPHVRQALAREALLERGARQAADQQTTTRKTRRRGGTFTLV